LKKLLKNTLLVSCITFFSRVFGLARDVTIAAVFGAGLYTDAFFVSFKGFDFLRKLYSEGVLSSSFIPEFTGHMASGGPKKAYELANSALVFVTILSVGIMAAGMAGAPFLLNILAPGFDPASYSFALSVLLVRIMMPYTVFIFLLAVCMGVLNASGRFTAPAFAPVVLNLTIILFTMWFAGRFHPPVLAVASGVSVGGLLQLLLLVPAIRKSGWVFTTGIRIRHPGVLAAAGKLVPAVIGASACHINMITATFIGSALSQGGVSYLYYADRLVQLPVALIAASFSIVLLPSLSGKAVTGNISRAGELVTDAARLVFFFTVPAAAGLAALNAPLVAIFFHHGAFGEAAAANTSRCVLVFIIGVWAFAGTRLFVNIFYAFSDMRIPFRAGILSIGLNLVLSLLLAGKLGYQGLALAVSISGIVNFILLLKAAGSFAPFEYKKVIFSACRAVAASVILYFPVSVSAKSLYNEDTGLLMEILLLTGTVVAGIFIYSGIQVVFKSPEIKLMKDLIRKREKTE